MIAQRWFTHPLVPKVARQGTYLSCGATSVDWSLLLGFPLPFLFLVNYLLKWPFLPLLKQSIYQSRHLPLRVLLHIEHVGTQVPTYATLTLECSCLSLKFYKFFPWCSTLFLGERALENGDAWRFCFYSCCLFEQPLYFPNTSLTQLYCSYTVLCPLLWRINNCSGCKNCLIFFRHIELLNLLYPLS